MVSFRIPFLRPPLNSEEWKSAYAVMSGPNISVGPETQEFEHMFRNYIGCDSALSVCNGSIALDLIWKTYLHTGRLKRGDKVLLPSFTFVAVANSIVNAGLVPVFCDIDPETWNIKIDGWECGINQIKALVSVHTFGNPCDMDIITSFCNQFDILLIEDCAEACGAEFYGKKVGTFGDAAAFSFNATKNMTTGEGGMVCFNGDEYGEQGYAALLKENGYGYTSRNAILPGYNYRLSNIQCAIGLAQLESLDNRNFKRKENAERIMNEFNEDMFQKINYDHVYQIFGVLVKNREKALLHLINNGIECKKYFSPPITDQQYYAKNYIHPDLPNTDRVAEHIISLPMYPQLSDEDIEFMIEMLYEVV